MCSRSCSPADQEDDHKNKDDSDICWPQGGWSELNLPPGPPSTSHEALNTRILHQRSMDSMLEMPIGEADPLYLDS
jgi:hypothetical protein